MCSRTIARLLAVLLLLSLTIVHVTPARAADTADNEDAIEAAIQEGIALRRAGNDEDALTRFLELERKNPSSVRVLLHVTAAAQATGRWLLAHAYLRKASAFKNDPYYVRNRAAVKNVEDAVARHVTELRVVGQPAGAEVRLSGNRLGTLPFQEPVAVEIGSYVLEVSKPGFYQLRRELTLNAGGTLVQEVVALSPSNGPGASLAVPRGGTEAHTKSPMREPAPSFWKSRAVTWSLAGMAVAGAATSGVALVLREQKIARWNDEGSCIDRENVTRSREDACGGERDAAQTAGTVALTSGIVAAVFATATLTHWLTTSSKLDEHARHEPHTSCGAGLGSLVCSGTF